MQKIFKVYCKNVMKEMKSAIDKSSIVIHNLISLFL